MDELCVTGRLFKWSMHAVEAYSGILLAVEKRRNTNNLFNEAFLNSEQSYKINKLSEQFKTAKSQDYGSPLARAWHHMKLDYNHAIKGQSL